MLFRQHFRGHHQARLIPRFRRGRKRKLRDHGLARAHVALQKPLHGMGSPKVRGNLAPCPLLSARQIVGKACKQRLRKAVAIHRTAVRNRLRLLPEVADREKEAEEFVEGKPPHGFPRRLLRLRKMRLLHSVL